MTDLFNPDVMAIAERMKAAVGALGEHGIRVEATVAQRPDGTPHVDINFDAEFWLTLMELMAGVLGHEEELPEGPTMPPVEGIQ